MSIPWPCQREPSKLDIWLDCAQDPWRCSIIFKVKFKSLGSITHTAYSRSSYQVFPFPWKCPLPLLLCQAPSLPIPLPSRFRASPDSLGCIPGYGPSAMAPGSHWAQTTLYGHCWFIGPSCLLDYRLCRSRNEVKWIFPLHLTLVSEKESAHKNVQITMESQAWGGNRDW